MAESSYYQVSLAVRGIPRSPISTLSLRTGARARRAFIPCDVRYYPDAIIVHVSWDACLRVGIPILLVRRSHLSFRRFFIRLLSSVRDVRALVPRGTSGAFPSMTGIVAVGFLCGSRVLGSRSAANQT